MNALTQYLELYMAHKGIIAQGCPEAMNERRLAARDFLTKRQEHKLSRQLDALLAPDYGVNLQRLDWGVKAAASLGCAVPRIPAILVVVAGDTPLMPRDLPEGLEIKTMRQAPEHLLRQFYARIMPGDSLECQLNTLLVQDGIYIHVAKNVKVDRPIQLLNVLHAPVPQMALRRVLVVMEEGAEASVLSCDHTQDDQQPYLVSRVVEMSLAAESRLDWCDLEESSPLTGRLNGLYARQASSSRVNINHSTLQGGSTLNDVKVELEGDHADASLAGMVIADDRMDASNRTLVVHQARYCTSRQLYKHIADGEGSVTFDGLVNVRPGAVGTDGRQSAHTILASDKARVHAQPHLIIDCDDVKCSHGATTGTLDENALFYMQQRGIPLEQARKMLMQAFMEEVITTVPIEGLRQSLHTLVDRRLSGQKVTCRGCSQ